MSRSLRTYAVSGCVGIALCLISVGSIETAGIAAEKPTPTTTTIPNEQRIENVLEGKTDVEFSDHPMNEVMDFLSEVHNIPIVLDDVSLTDEGIPIDETINLIIADVTLRNAFALMLKPLGLTYVIEDGVLKITTVKTADSRMAIRLYDVRDLEEAGFSGEDLKRVITQCVRNDTWKIEGQAKQVVAYARSSSRGAPPVRIASPKKGAVEPLSGCLVVTQSLPAHREVLELLKKLREHVSQMNTPAMVPSPLQ